MTSYRCKIHKGTHLVKRTNPTADQAWCGTWYDCPESNLTAHTGCSTVLVPSAELTIEREAPTLSDASVARIRALNLTPPA